MVFGLQEDTEKAITEYIEAQENAGTQKIVDELQKQVDEFLKEN